MNGVDSQVPSLALGFFKYIGVQEEAAGEGGRLKMAKIIFLIVVLLVSFPVAYPHTRRNSGVLFYWRTNKGKKGYEWN